MINISGVCLACRNIWASFEKPFLGLSPWHDVMCNTLKCMLGDAAVGGYHRLYIMISIITFGCSLVEGHPLLCRAICCMRCLVL